ncbi:MAG: hypothetical protein IPK79_10470 [Vampirovibrionales bacterium]|nr:hypothetical protein [Vampirovibrionales bacterium]
MSGVLPFSRPTTFFLTLMKNATLFDDVMRALFEAPLKSVRTWAGRFCVSRLNRVATLFQAQASQAAAAPEADAQTLSELLGILDVHQPQPPQFARSIRAPQAQDTPPPAGSGHARYPVFPQRFLRRYLAQKLAGLSAPVVAASVAPCESAVLNPPLAPGAAGDEAFDSLAGQSPPERPPAVIALTSARPDAAQLEAEYLFLWAQALADEWFGDPTPLCLRFESHQAAIAGLPAAERGPPAPF